MDKEDQSNGDTNAGRYRQLGRPTEHDHFIPTPEQIAAECALIRAEWSAEEEQRRARGISTAIVKNQRDSSSRRQQ